MVEAVAWRPFQFRCRQWWTMTFHTFRLRLLQYYVMCILICLKVLMTRPATSANWSCFTMRCGGWENKESECTRRWLDRRDRERAEEPTEPNQRTIRWSCASCQMSSVLPAGCTMHDHDHACCMRAFSFPKHLGTKSRFFKEAWSNGGRERKKVILDVSTSNKCHASSNKKLD